MVLPLKKGQFLSPESIKHAVTKVKERRNNTIMITDRGTMFGYQDIVVDFRGIPTMKQFGVPVVMDITHSLQQPNQDSGITGGNPEMIETIAKAAIATGVDGIFLETHPNPSKAKSDGANMLELDKLLPEMIKIYPKSNIKKEIIGEIIGFNREKESDACEFVSNLIGNNSREVVSFGTEAGLFQEIGISTVVCGPGSIEQAHKVDEYILLDEIKKCLLFLEGIKNNSSKINSP